MDDELEAEFERIAQEAIEKASAIECPLSVFAAGLRVMQVAVQDRADDVDVEVEETDDAEMED